MPTTGHRGVGVGMDDAGCLLSEVDFLIRCDSLKHFKIKPKIHIYMEMCQHGKTNKSIHRISEFCKTLA